MKDELSAIEKHFQQTPEDKLENSHIPTITPNLLDNFIKDFNRIINASEAHQSVDTFAKKLYLQGKFSELKKLKIILSIYFILIQSKKNADYRYDGFFASILENKFNNFPKDLRILSWNYDYQFEKAYAEYSEDFRFDACNETLNIVSKNSGRFSEINNGFGLLKLNGTASFMLNKEQQRKYHYFNEINQKYDNTLINTCLQNYYSILHNDNTKDKFNPSLSFAWEEDSNTDSIIDEAIKSVIETEVLVVIGYSFPVFNRKVDRKFIRSMDRLKKVYFQAPDAENLKERFLAIRDNIEDENLVLRKDVEQFVFPNEF